MDDGATTVAVRWSKAMSVGVEALDSDHRVLIDLIARVASAGEADDDARVVLAEVLAELVAYTIYHFDREEHVMAACGYPDLAAHREEHHALTREVEDLQSRFNERERGLGVAELLRFLTGWLNHHILLQDKAYRPYAEGNPTAIAAAEAYGEYGRGTGGSRGGRRETTTAP